jgi:hypothetical protein
MGMTEWRNWSGSVVAHPAAIARPRDEEELASIVRAAQQVRVTGAGHSFMPLCETTGRCCQSNANSSPHDGALAMGAAAQLIRVCHSASAAERRSL